MTRSLLLLGAAVVATFAATPADAALTNRPKGQRCATEGGVCRFAGKAVVYYGARRNWTQRRLRGPVRCDNRTFGDPLRGVRKSCFVLRGGGQPARLKPGVGMTNRPQGQRCAGENQVCRFGGQGRVYYGAQNRWAVRNANRAIGCNNGVFGDPLPGVRKSCFVQRVGAQPARLKPGVGMVASPRGQRCAQENGVCRFQGNGTVYYGARNRWATRGANGVLTCNNQTFGDPLPGVRKSCFVLQRPMRHPGVQTRPHPVPHRARAVTLFEHANYKGRRSKFGPGRWDIHQLGPVGNDRVSSLVVPPGMEVVVFEHAAFRGKRRVYRNNANFVGHAFNDKVSSLIVRRR